MDGFFNAHRVILPFFIGGWDISISDFSLSIFFFPAVISMFFAAAIFKAKRFPGLLQNLVEYIWESCESIFRQHVGNSGEGYIPFLFSLMLFIFFVNLGNLIPGFFPCTGQLTVTLSLSFMVFLLVCGIGFYEHGNKFWNFFIPQGIPFALKPILFVLELFSFCMRPFSLGLRLCINMVAGHMILHVISSFGKNMGKFIGCAMAISALMTCFEIGVAALQAYVFAILSSIYIGDIMQGHHNESEGEK